MFDGTDGFKKGFLKSHRKNVPLLLDPVLRCSLRLGVQTMTPIYIAWLNSTCALGKARLPTRPCQKLALWDRKGNALFCFRASIKHAQIRWTYTWNQNKGTERGLKPVLVGLSFRSLSPILFFTFRCFSFLLFCIDIFDLCHSRFFFEFLLLFLWCSLQFILYVLFCFPVCTFLFFCQRHLFLYKYSSISFYFSCSFFLSCFRSVLYPAIQVQTVYPLD